MQTSRKTSPRSSWVDVAAAADATVDAAPLQPQSVASNARASAPDESIVFVTEPKPPRAAMSSSSSSPTGSRAHSRPHSPPLSRSSSLVLVPPPVVVVPPTAQPLVASVASVVSVASAPPGDDAPLDVDELLRELCGPAVADAPAPVPVAYYTSPVTVARTGGADALSQLVLNAALPDTDIDTDAGSGRDGAVAPTREQVWGRALDALHQYSAATPLHAVAVVQTSHAAGATVAAVPQQPRDARYTAAHVAVAASAGMACGLLLAALWLRAQHQQSVNDRRPAAKTLTPALPPPTHSAVVPAPLAPVPVAPVHASPNAARAPAPRAVSPSPSSQPPPRAFEGLEPPLREQMVQVLSELMTETMGLVNAFRNLIQLPPAVLPRPMQALHSLLQQLL